LARIRNYASAQPTHVVYHKKRKKQRFGYNFAARSSVAAARKGIVVFSVRIGTIHVAVLFPKMPVVEIFGEGRGKSM